MLSILIPTLNEASSLGETLASLQVALAHPEDCEIVVSDCNSQDETVSIAHTAGVRVIQHPQANSRAAALNLAAAEAQGDQFLFLHADTRVPASVDRCVLEALEDQKVVGGAFSFSLQGSRPVFRVIEALNRIRYRVQWHIFYGDQGIFCQRSSFEAIGGVPELPIMEDAAFCRRLKTQGKLVLRPERMITSPRRFVEHGPWRMLGWDFWMVLRDLVGLNNHHYAQAYRKQNEERGS